MIQSNLTSIIILIGALTLTMTGLTMLMSDAEDAYGEAACRASVLAKGELGDAAGNSVAAQSPLSCPTKDVGELQGSKEEQMKEIADLSATCWWMFAEGAVDNVFDKDTGKKGCHTCYRFKPGDNVGLIEGTELTQFMLNNTYNPSVIKGGGSQLYIGDGVEMRRLQATGDKSKIDLTDITAQPLREVRFTDDATGILTDEDQEKLSEELGELFAQTDIAPYIVIAHNITNHNRRSAQQAMERLQLTEEGNETKGILITVDLGDGKARLDAGRDVTAYFSEYEIKELLHPLSALADQQDLGVAVKAVVSNLQEKTTAATERSYDPSSYYGYISSKDSFPMIANNITSNATYTVSFVAPSNYGDFFEHAAGWMGQVGALGPEAALGAGVGAGGAAAGAAIGGFFIGGPAGAAVLGTLVGGTVGAAVGSDGGDVVKFTELTSGRLEQDEPVINNLLIAKNSNVVNVCNDE